ncbi:hypothetical protein [Chitinophaga arvensicola]|uniref:Peptidylprolyl isomerase n=1 Tax=Chitinophaga arvensicola TaxID=29529 RepID=A0A1I0RQF1_9BACT|nr:hypothetical protein [Chitinophaga arvensicola]SEW43587.1 hypothetical protein SAMN04488122_3237 [Chitinophaga arvensicola]
MKTLISWLLMMSITYAVTAQTTAYVNVTLVEPDLVTTIFGKDKQSLLADNLKISPLEEKAFEEAFLDYETEKGPWLAERIALLKMYNEEFTSLDNAKLNTLTKQMINNDLEFGRLQMRYFRKMNKLLGATRAAKFFQLDSYIEQSTRVYIQKQLPFIKALESDKQGPVKILTSR